RRDGPGSLPIPDRAPDGPARPPSALPLALLGLGLRTRALCQSGFEHRLRAPPQPGTAAALGGGVRGRAPRGDPARARASDGDRRRQQERQAPGRGAVNRQVRLGLRENAAQFSLLVAVNAFVGAMVGLERSALPLLGREDFGLTSSVAVLSFIVAFGVVKAFTNLGAGALAERLGRRRLLIAGWAVALPVPPLLAVAPRRGW